KRTEEFLRRRARDIHCGACRGRERSNLGPDAVEQVEEAIDLSTPGRSTGLTNDGQRVFQGMRLVSDLRSLYDPGRAFERMREPEKARHEIRVRATFF